MRILVAHSYYRTPGGEDRYVDQQVDALGARHEVRLVRRANLSLTVGLGTAARMTYSPRERSSIDRAIDAFRPDVIHLHNPYPSFGPAVHLAAAAHGIPLVVTAHNFRLRCPNGLMFTEGAPCRRCEAGAYGHAVAHHCFASRSQSAAYASALWIHRFGFRLERLVDVHIAPSRFMRDRLEAWGIAPDRIALAPNFTDVEPASPEPGAAGMYLGRLSEEKGVDILLRALRIAGDPPFRVVGGGPAAGELARLARELGLGNTHFTGRLERDDVLRELRAARFVVFPSTWDENAPLAALEAMAVGRPLLVTRTGGLAELVEGGTGLACEPGDAAGMATAIGTLMQDDALCREAGTRAAERARIEYSPARHLARLEQIYGALTAPARPVPVPRGDGSSPAPVPRAALPRSMPSPSSGGAAASAGPDRRTAPIVLMAHCYYRDLGGENLSYEAEAALLRRSGRTLLTYTRSNREIDELGTVGRARAAARTVWADDAYREVEALVVRERPQVAHFQNTFPLMSPSVYRACRRHGVAVVQALRNYRLTCVNGLLFRDGRVCEDCLGRTVPWPGVVHACYRDSAMQSGVAAAMIGAHNMLGTWDHEVDAYVVPSEFSRAKHIEAGLPAEKLFVKPNFVYPDPGPNPVPGSYALFAGRLAAEKGILTVLDAWRRVGPVPLKIVGDGPLTPDVRRAIAAMGLAPGVELIGHVAPEAVIDALRGARMAIFPSEWYETFGRVAAEAFACGVPVIASRTGAVAEVVADGVTGLHFTPGDPEDLAAKVTWAWDHPADLGQLGRQARLEFEQRFTADRNLQLLEELYDMAIRRAHGRASAA